jgi:hypothetical protein
MTMASKALRRSSPVAHRERAALLKTLERSAGTLGLPRGMERAGRVPVGRELVKRTMAPVVSGGLVAPDKLRDRRFFELLSGEV